MKQLLMEVYLCISRTTSELSKQIFIFIYHPHTDDFKTITFQKTEQVNQKTNLETFE